MNIKKISYAIVIGAIFLIPVFPLIVANSYFFPFITGKAFYFRIFTEIAFASWVILAFLEPEFRPKKTNLTIVVTVFTVIALIADLLGVNPIRSLWSNFERMEGWITIVHLWAFYIMTTSFFNSSEKGRRMWHYWLYASLGIGTIVGLYGVAQLIGSDSWFQNHIPATSKWFAEHFAVHQGYNRLDASLGNSAYMAVYMLFQAFLSAYLFFYNTPKKLKSEGVARFLLTAGSITSILLLLASIRFNWIVVLANLVLIAGVVFLYKTKQHLLPSFWQGAFAFLTVFFSVILFETQTRGTILGWVGGITLALILYAIFGEKDQIKYRKISGGVIAFIFVLAALFWVNRHQPWIETNPILGRFSNLSWNEASNQARQYIWPMALKGAIEKPIFGWGQENFNYIFNAKYDPAMYSQEQWFDRAHNVFIDWFVASGFVGLLAYLALYAFLILAVWKSDLTVGEKSILTGLVAGYAIHNFFVFDNLASYVMFFACLGLVNSMAIEAPEKKIVAKPVSNDVVEYVVAPIAIVALVFVIYFFNIRAIQANTGLITALSYCNSAKNADPALFQKVLAINVYVANQETREQLLTCSANVINSPDGAGPNKQAFLTLLGQALQDQIAATPEDARIYTLGGSTLLSIGSYDKSAELLEKAHQLSPAKQTIDLALATAYFNINKLDQAETLLKQAYDSAPAFDQAKTAYATALVLNGKEAKAHELFGNDPSIFGTSQMATVYMRLKEYAKALAIFNQMVKDNPENADAWWRVAQVQYTMGDTYSATLTLKKIAEKFPQFKEQVDGAIKQINK